MNEPDDDEAEQAYEREQAVIIASCIRDLYQADPGDDRFRIFDAIALHAENLFDGPLAVELAAGQLTESSTRKLMASPAAPILLAYFVDSLLSFNAMNGEYLGESTPTVAAKRRALTDSFRLIGKSGEKHGPIEERMGRALWFRHAYAKALVDEQAKRGGSSSAAEKAASKTAERALFRETYGVDFVYTDDTHKARMKVLRQEVERMPGLLGTGDSYGI